MAIKFNQRVKHGGHDFHPGVAYSFDDADAEPYFKICGWAEDTDDDPAVTFTAGEVDIDPCTIWADGANKHKFVMPERAADARGMTLEDAQAYVWNGEDLRNG